MTKSTLIFLLVASSAQAKLLPIQYEDAFCVCKGEVDSSLASKPEDVQTAMAWGLRGGADVSSWTQWAQTKPDDLKALKSEDENKLNKSEEKTKKASLPQGPEWNEIREKELRDLRLTRHLQMANLDYLISGETTPLTKSFEGQELPSQCRKFADTLKSSKKLKKEWSAFTKETCRDNGAPQMCQKNLKKQTEGPDGLYQMKVHYLSLGWHNCANQSWRKDTAKDVTLAQEKLKSSIQNLKCSCEGP